MSSEAKSNQVKRRATARRKQAKRPSNDASKNRTDWRREGLSVVLAAFSLLLLFSVAAQLIEGSILQDWLEDYLNINVHNLIGPFGKTIGVFLVKSMGWCSIVPVLWVLLLAVTYWQERKSPESLSLPNWVNFLGSFGVFVFSCAIGSIFFAVDGGGTIGGFLAVPVQKLFNKLGAFILFYSLLVLSVRFAVPKAVKDFINQMNVYSKLAVRALFIGLPVFLYYTAVSFVDRGIATLKHVFGPQKEPHSFPKPRIRKNVIKLKTAKEDLEDEPYDHNDLEVGEGGEDDPDYIEPLPSDTKPPEIVMPKKVNEAAAMRLQKKRKEASKRSFVKDEDTGDPREVYKDYRIPDLALLVRSEGPSSRENDEDLRQKSRQIESKLRDFNIYGRVTRVHPGPVITLFEFEPAAGVKVGKIQSLENDLAMSLKAVSIRVIAPIPGKGTVGIEVPNRQRDIVRLRDVLESEESLNAESILTVAFGKDVYGNPEVADIASMPHLLMAGATGTGKSVCINSILVSLLYRASPVEMGLIMIDPKILELSVYEGIPHLRAPIVTVPKKAKAVLDWAAKEMDRRYHLMQKFGVRNIDSYNQIVAGDDSKKEDKKQLNPLENKIEQNADGLIELSATEIVEQGTVDLEAAVIDGKIENPVKEELKPLPKLVIVIDELADLMLTVGKEVEELITRLAQKARAAGIHLIVATQRPSVDVITGLIKANFPARLSFKVSSRVDSRTILDCMGADKLLGKGDMLVFRPGVDGLKRVHGAFISDAEVKKVVTAVKEQGFAPMYDTHIMQMCEKVMQEETDAANGEGGTGADEYDEFYDKAVQLVLEKGQASVSMIQRVFRIGYNRAARIVEQMEKDGIVGPMDGAKPRQVIGGSE